MAKETENKELDKETLKKGIDNLISHSKYGKYFVAVDNENKPLGCLMITFELSPELGGLIYWIQSVYVREEARKQGVFRKLYEHVIKMAREDQEGKSVRLYVDYDNKSAMQVYEKMGMQKLDQYDFEEIDLHFEHH